MIYAILIAAGVAMAVLYKFSPSRQIFITICSLLVMVFGMSVFIHNSQVQQEQITRAQREELQARQKIFGDWYAAYQKDIDRLDRNWQSYHNILEGLDTTDAQSFNAAAIHERLKELEQESIDEQVKIYMLKPPSGLDEENRALVEAIINKTQRYVDAQTQTISKSATAANPPVELETLRLRLHDIMIRESPEGLFTAQEISAIRSALDD